MKRTLLLMACVVPAACSSKPSPEVAAEIATRELVARGIAADAGSLSAWNVSSTNEILYDSGFSVLLHDPEGNFRAPAFRWMGQNAHVRLHTHGGKPMKLQLVGWVHEKVTMTRPVISAYIDGQLVLTTDNVPDHGHFNKSETIPAALVSGDRWVDLRITVNAVAFHWADAPDLRVIVLNELHWTEAE